MSRHLALLALFVALFAGCSSHRGPATSTTHDEDPFVHEAQQAALLDFGFDALVQRIALIRSARSRIDVQTFIYADDAAGRLIMSELAAAADRGVRVRVLIDAMFCAIPPDRLARLRRLHPGLAIAVYNPKPGDVVASRKDLQDEVHAGLNHRMHNKLLVVDGVTGITGGRNHEDTYFDIGQGLNYRDREVLIRGTAVRRMAACAAAWWFHPLVVPVDQLIAVSTAVADGPLPAEALDQRVAQVRSAIDGRIAAGAAPIWREVPQVAFCWDVPGRPEAAGASSTVAGLDRVIAGTKHQLRIVSPYCVLNSRTLERLQDLRERGLSIGILTNSLASTDAWWAFGGYLRDRRRLVAAGVALGETRPHPFDLPAMWSDAADVAALRQGGKAPFLSLHAKCVLADGSVSVVGTFNLDPRSKNINTEQVLILWGEAIASDLGTLIERDSAPRNAWCVGQRDLGMGWFHAPFIRLSEWTGDWLSLDVYPVQPTTCFEPVPGAPELPFGAAGSEASWRDAGLAPEAGEEEADRAELMQTFGAVLTPLL